MSISQRYEPDFSQVIRARGEHYFRDGRVRVLRQDVDVIEADVQCSEPYRVQVAFEGDRLDADCGCAYFRDHGACKHVWAVLREIDEGGNSPVESIVDSREPEPDAPTDVPTDVPTDAPTALESVQDPASEPAADAAGAFSYLLDLDRARARGLPSVQILEPTGTGRFAPRRVSRSEVRDLTVDSDRRLLGHLFRLGLDPDEETTPYPNASSLVECSAFPLRDPDLPALFALLCATGRFHLRRAGRVSRPVSWDSAAEHTLGFGFVLADDPGDDGGHLWRLVAFLEDDRERIAFADADVVLEGVVILGERALAYDPDSHYARVEKTLAPNTPPLAQKERDRVVARLLSAEDGPRVDLPEEWLRGATDVPPRPILSIIGGGKDFAAAAADPAHEVVCGLAFERDGHRWPAGSSAREVCDLRQRVVWARDPALEEQAEARLAVLGAWPDPDDRCLWKLRGGTLESTVQALSAEGWRVELRERPYRGEGRLRLRVSSGVDWFELEGDLEIDGDRLPLAAVLEAARRRERTVDLPDGSTGTIPGNWVERLALLSSLAQSTRGKSAGAGDAPLRFQRTQGWLLDTLLEDQPVDVDAEFRKYRESLETFRGIEPVDPPATFEGTLRSYQQDALGWFDFLHRFGFGGCLADDMGLGKTVQVLAMLEADRTAGHRGPSLVAAPRSVVYNWVEEARRFVPGLRAVEYGGEYREGDIANLGELDLIVISYGLLRRDITRLKDVSFRHVILDEAQAIKNSASQTAKCARLLRGEHRLALSGTPLENHLGELWSIFEFLNPGMLGRGSGFRRVFTSRNPEPHECALLASALRPFLLRRTKDQVEKELPEKTEQTLLCDMLPGQQAAYDNLARHYRATLLGRVAEEGIRSTRMPILEALLRLRQVACHPALVDKESPDDASGKLEWLVPQLEEIVEEGHKALVFSQFTSFLAIVQRRLEKAGIPFEYLDGSTRNRRARVARFQTDAKCPVFLISLKAGGLGLNLTAADYVFILDPWWNPAVEAQAIDRTHRIGQTRRVFAYRAIARGTVEEKILELQQRKRDLADSIIRADGSLLSSLTREDLELLLTATPES